MTFCIKTENNNIEWPDKWISLWNKMQKRTKLKLNWSGKLMDFGSSHTNILKTAFVNADVTHILRNNN